MVFAVSPMLYKWFHSVRISCKLFHVINRKLFCYFFFFFFVIHRYIQKTRCMEKWNAYNPWYLYTDFLLRVFEIVTFQLIISLKACHASRDVPLFTIKRYNNNYNFLQLQLLRLERFKTIRTFRRKKYIYISFPFLYFYVHKQRINYVSKKRSRKRRGILNVSIAPLLSLIIESHQLCIPPFFLFLLFKTLCFKRVKQRIIRWPNTREI